MIGFDPRVDASLQTGLWLCSLVGVLWLLRALRRFYWGFSLLLLPGTFAHEMCHLVTGWLLNGQPVKVSLIPRRQAQGVELGSVGFRNLRWYNAFFVGMAPLLLLPLAWWLLRPHLRAPLTLSWIHALWIYLNACLIQASVPSGQDLRIAARSPLGWLLLAAGLTYAMRGGFGKA